MCRPPSRPGRAWEVWACRDSASAEDRGEDWVLRLSGLRGPRRAVREELRPALLDTYDAQVRARVGGRLADFVATIRVDDVHAPVGADGDVDEVEEVAAAARARDALRAHGAA